MTDPDLISPLLSRSRGDRLLDLCCGTAVLKSWAAHAGWNYVGLDMSMKMLLQASAAASPTSTSLVRGNAQISPFSDKTFDVVVCRQGLHYLDVPEAVKEMWRLARVEVRVAQIVAESAADVDFWTSYFGLASPGRRRVFVAGDIPSAFAELGLREMAVSYVESRGTLMGAVRHLSQEAQQQVRGLFRSADARIKRIYGFRELGDADIEYRQIWEFSTFSCDGTAPSASR